MQGRYRVSRTMAPQWTHRANHPPAEMESPKQTHKAPLAPNLSGRRHSIENVQTNQPVETVPSMHVGGIEYPEFTDAELAKLTGTALEDWKLRVDAIRSKEAYISDMDGVVYHGGTLLPGVKEFIEWMKTNNKKFLFLTNNSGPTPQELSQKMKRLGVDVPPAHFYTSGMATAEFLKAQRPEGGSVYVIGEPGLHLALYSAGFIMNVRIQFFRCNSFQTDANKAGISSRFCRHW